ncbi:MAG: GGDEF domain-containing protein [Cyanobacteriota bacterium]|nr:GGDEF domain-containing protein [Cyanobacteriota bacterium]
MKAAAFLSKQTTTVQITLGFMSIGLISLLDLLTGDEIALSLFYVLPISFLTWCSGQSLGWMASLVSAVVWLWADGASGHSYSSLMIPIWNTLIRLSLFVILVLFLSAWQKAGKREAAWARTDHLTGAINSRYFYMKAQEEIDRFQRYGRAFSLLYIDLDHFKMVNDCWGHMAGDEVLRVLVKFMQTHIRRTDILARLGGDEFALLLPETDADTVRVVCMKIQAGFLAEMERKHWPVTLSMGVLTCEGLPPSVEELVKLADEQMYAVKQSGKNGIQYSRYLG